METPQWLVVLGETLDTPQAVRAAASLARSLAVLLRVDDEGREVRCCKISTSSKTAIEKWCAAQGIARPEFAPYDVAEKEFEAYTVYPTLGVDTTIPQFRGTVGVMPSPMEDEYPV
ncbi:hypothetical protein M501DRAFT_1029337 [Patellaria atrata CBS 101060]|uniref:Uncharacterized protein n=1 Tax=Patellaria atrata CBS 101060 TaxID=1346257 RepID=A0A9P4SF19_9PEZI|nr:hypothetical protein M501DRAFT_1029337 [Patellaria atrata CBS 101060]